MIAAFVMALAAAEPSVAGAARDALLAESQVWLLEGRGLPGDIESRLAALPPADRIEVIVFLRRSGLLTDIPWHAERLLSPERP